MTSYTIYEKLFQNLDNVCTGSQVQNVRRSASTMHFLSSSRFEALINASKERRYIGVRGTPFVQDEEI